MVGGIASSQIVHLHGQLRYVGVTRGQAIFKFSSSSATNASWLSWHVDGVPFSDRCRCRGRRLGSSNQDFTAKPVKIWSIRLAAPIFAALVFVEALASLLALSVEGKMQMLQDKEGQAATGIPIVVWSLSLDGEAFAAPCVHEASLLAFVGTHGAAVSAVQLQDGVLLWRCKVADVVYGSPFLLAGRANDEDLLIFVATRSGVLHLLDSNGSQCADAQLSGQVFSSPVAWCANRQSNADQDRVYVGVGCRDNHVYCFELVSRAK